MTDGRDFIVRPHSSAKWEPRRFVDGQAGAGHGSAGPTEILLQAVPRSPRPGPPLWEREKKKTERANRMAAFAYVPITYGGRLERGVGGSLFPPSSVLVTALLPSL